MNINTNTEVTLYDFLNYEVIGVLLLFICGFTPNDLTYEWVFFVFAFIAGLVFSKLAENAFWIKWTRNPKWIICKGVEIVNKDISIEDDKIVINDYEKSNKYLKDYYRITKEPIYKTIQILETQYRFMENLLLLTVICFFVGASVSDNLRHFLCVDVYSKHVEMLIIVYIVMSLFAYLGCVIKNSCLDNNYHCCIVDLKCVAVLCLTVSFFLGLAVLIMPNSLTCVSLFVMIILGILACKIQLKISTLVIAGAYYLHKTDNQEEKILTN